VASLGDGCVSCAVRRTGVWGTGLGEVEDVVHHLEGQPEVLPVVVHHVAHPRRHLREPERIQPPAESYYVLL